MSGLKTLEDTTNKVSFINPINGAILKVGEVLNVEAKIGSALTGVSLWFDDTKIGTLTSAPYKWELSDLAEKTYQLKLIASNGEGTIAMDSISVIVSDYALEGTPFGTSKMIYFKGLTVIQAKIYTLSGQMIKSTPVLSNQVDVSQFEKGMYLIQIEAKNGTLFTERFVVE